MLDGLKNKLRAAFGMKAKPPAKNEVPAEIVNNKFVQKAVIKKVRRSHLRKLGIAFAASAALSTGLQYAPDLVSTKLDTFMAEKNFAGDFSQNFHAQEIRVYDRFNPLYPFHLAGNATKITWHEGMKDGGIAAIPLTIATPFLYTGMLWQGFTDMLPGNKLDAFSISNDDPAAQRTVYIRPPGDFSLTRFMGDFSGVNGQKLEFQSDREILRDILFQFVMLHEARHGDQDKSAYGLANESDADLYAFKVMKARGTDEKLLNEAATIVAHARAINGAVGGDYGHASTFTFQRGEQRIFDAHQDAAAFDRLHALLTDIDARNHDAFPDNMPRGNRYLYLTLAMHKQGLLEEDPGLKKAADAFIRSLAYFDRASNGKIIDNSYDLSKIDLGYLTMKYKPVPDKLTPAKAPAAPRPNS
ncbi:MAG: hypothetical protein K0R10_677 [Alphaproteobacteria bacterium]|jgi:hypothetical protein|nr:hypothetical protein [Alphaproteobacteria bacterium]